MLQFFESASFFSIEERDAYNLNPSTKKRIYIDASKIVSLEQALYGQVEGTYRSSDLSTHIQTVNGKWTVEGDIETIAAIVDAATQ
jgi:hypothetical protein